MNRQLSKLLVVLVLMFMLPTLPTQQTQAQAVLPDIGNRSGCQNRTLVITSSDGVPCTYGYAPLIATGTLGTDSA
jgi:hypothetical protein